MKQNFKELLPKVKGFVFDVDGVFTAFMLLSANGEQIRSMNMKDGYAVQYAIKKGYPIAIITGGTCYSINMRFSKLGVEHIYISSKNKEKDFDDFLSKTNLNPDELLYMGDDIPDYKVMSRVGVPTCPADAVPEIKAISKYVSSIKGGQGCVRDVIEQVLKSQNNWFNKDAFEW